MHVDLRAALVMLACAACPRAPDTTPPSKSEETRTTLVVPADVPIDFMMRQKLVASHGGRKLEFEAVLQKQGDTLTIVGLTPFGTRAFTVVQRGSTVELEAHGEQKLPFPPEYVLDDVARAFLWVPARPKTGCCSEREQGGERVTETWEGALLIERVFERVDQEPKGRVIVHYDPGMGERPPPRTTLRNERHGYVIDIETFDYRVLDPR
jgi:hypothetical protein